MSDTNNTNSFPSTGGFKTGGNISTNTILLSRKKMGLDSLSSTTTTSHPEEIKQQSIVAAVTPTEMPVVKRMTAEMVWCPKCNCGFEISSEFYGILAECSECGLEFQIPNEPIEIPKPRITAPPQHAMRNRTTNIGNRTSSAKKKKNNSNMIYYVIITIIVAIIIGLIVKG
ncbi:MAG: hypothetical protein ACRC37_03350 [Lentisphaeria bacterium]